MVSYSIHEITYRCACKEEKKRPTTKAEKRDLGRAWTRMFNPKRERNVHYVWHKFKKQVFDKAVLSGGQDNNLAFVARCERFAKRYPNDVFICPCDDSHHMSSDMVLIYHRCETSWMGITVIVVPQVGNVPVEIFWYPSHAQVLLERLMHAMGEAKRLRKAEKAHKRSLPVHPTLKFKLDV